MRNRWHNLAFVALSVLVALGAVEGGFRLFGIYLSISGPPRYLTRADANLVYSLEPNGVWPHTSQEFNYVIRTNQRGYRGADWIFDASAVAILGSSEVFGFGTALESTFAARLQALAAEAGLDHQVRNMGVFGHNLLQIRDAFGQWQSRSRVRAAAIEVDWRAVHTALVPSVFEVVEGYLVAVARFPSGKLSLAYRVYGVSYSHSRAAAVLIDGVRQMVRSARDGESVGPIQAAELSGADRLAVEKAADRVAEIRDLASDVPFGVFLMTPERRHFDAIEIALKARGIDVISTWEVSERLFGCAVVSIPRMVI